MKNKKHFLSVFFAVVMAFVLLLGLTSCNRRGNSDADDSHAAFFPSESLEENGFWKGIRALDFVEIFNYRALVVPREAHQVPDDTINETIRGILSNFTDMEHQLEGIVNLGDTINIDYVGSIDGEEFAGGNTFGMGSEVTVGVTSFIDDFLYQLIGHSPGDVVNVEVTFPPEYPQSPELAGRDALFVTTINYIVAEGEPPELTDAFIFENLFMMYGWQTVSDMKDEIREFHHERAVEQFISDYFANNVVVNSIPETLIRHQERSLVDYFEGVAHQMGMDFDFLFLNFYLGVEDEEELIESYYDDIISEARFALIVQAIAESEGMAVTLEEVEELFGADLPFLIEDFGLPFLKQYMMHERVLEIIRNGLVLQ
jgi:trigger factor